MKFISQLAKLVKRKKIFVMLYIANKLGQRINKYRATDKIKKKLKFKLRRRKTLRKLKNRKFKIFKKK